MTKEDEKVVAPIDLDAVHNESLHKIGNDNEPKEPEDEKEPELDEDIELEEKDIEEPEKPEEPVDSGDDVEAPSDLAERLKTEKEAKIPEDKPQEPVEPDKDITKPGDGKIAVKNSDGDTMYFNSADEVPDDFEPASYKEFMKAITNLAQKEIIDRESTRAKELADAEAKKQAEVEAVTSSWDRDIETLKKGGILPTDEKECETEINETYAYMTNKLNNGTIIDSFAEAYKGMIYERDIVTKTKEKKEKGNMVMGGSGAAPKKEAPAPLPAGITLDQVHQRYSGLV